MERALGAAVLDSLPDQLAVLASDGSLVGCNLAWRRFAEANGLVAMEWTGVNYLAVCRRAGDAGDAEAERVAVGIQEVIDGRTGEFRHEYPCHSSEEQRWFTLHVAPLRGYPGFVVVSHHDITARRLSEARVAQLNAELDRLSMTDGLTALGNRRQLDRALEIELARAQRYGAPFALVMFDVDHFKRLSDARGHEAGDRALVAVARCLAGACRQTDVPCRWGGDEFLVLLPGCDERAAEQFAGKVHRLTRAVAACSFGVTAFVAGDSSLSMLARVDRALYEAKAAGRDRVCVGHPTG